MFLLTDGCVGNPKDVINLVKSNSKTTRTHAIAVGSGASEYLVTECALKGNGKSIFVDDDADVSG